MFSTTAQAHQNCTRNLLHIPGITSLSGLCRSFHDGGVILGQWSQPSITAPYHKVDLKYIKILFLDKWENPHAYMLIFHDSSIIAYENVYFGCKTPSIELTLLPGNIQPYEIFRFPIYVLHLNFLTVMGRRKCKSTVIFPK